MLNAKLNVVMQFCMRFVCYNVQQISNCNAQQISVYNVQQISDYKCTKFLPTIYTKFCLDNNAVIILCFDASIWTSVPRIF